ncbi:macrophage mannose receptor 1-like isoform 2-T8 [Spinachia spinachia]
MKKALLFVLTLSGLSAQSPVFREYHQVQVRKTWAEAQRYCREKFTDLATVETPEEDARMTSALRGPGGNAWIGLFDNLKEWKWSLGDQDLSNDFTYWNKNRPDLKSMNKTCVLMRHNGVWADRDCTDTYAAVCYDEKLSKVIFVAEGMSWYEARTYCRSHHTDLASARSESENKVINSVVTNSSWIGLHRKTWAFWSDRTPRTFTKWDQSQPKEIKQAGRSCAAVCAAAGTWWDVACDAQNVFICEKVYSRRRHTFKLKFRSEADMNDPAAQQQLLEQLHARLEERGLSDFKLRWTQKDGQSFHKEPATEKKEGSCG